MRVQVMSQQTQLPRVVDYFTRWTARWPTVAALAAATQDEVRMHRGYALGTWAFDDILPCIRRPWRRGDCTSNDVKCRPAPKIHT